jgi:hypothetical protein
MDKGLLLWHGGPKMGRSAKGIDYQEVLRVLNKPAGKGGITRTRCRPVWRQVREFLYSFPAEFKHSPDDVLQCYLDAAAADADIDFLLYCIERLLGGDQFFVFMLMGEYVNSLMCDPLCQYAAKRLRELAARGHQSKTPRTSFHRTWYALGRLCLKASVSVDVDVVFDRTSRTASLKLGPYWLRDAPTGVTPVEGGHHSVITVRRSDDDQAVDRIATKIALKLEDSTDPDRWDRYQAFLACQTEEMLRNRLWSQRVDEYLGKRAFINKAGIAVSGSDASRIRGSLESISTAAGYFGLTLDEARTFLLAWSRLKADVITRSSYSYSDLLQAPDSPASRIITDCVLGKVFGVDRHTIAKWIKARSPSRLKTNRHVDSDGSGNEEQVPDGSDGPHITDDDWRVKTVEDGTLTSGPEQQ